MIKTTILIYMTITLNGVETSTQQYIQVNFPAGVPCELQAQDFVGHTIDIINGEFLQAKSNANVRLTPGKPMGLKCE